MDNSEKFILMCEKAVEIQKSWKLKVGDYYSFEGTQEISIVVNYESDFIDGHTLWKCGDMPMQEHTHKDVTVWLPRQDQLQDMLDDWALGAKITEFYRFFCPESNCIHDECPKDDNGFGCPTCSVKGNKTRMMYTSMEQLWLAFCMSELYQKKWNGKDWEVI